MYVVDYLKASLNFFIRLYLLVFLTQQYLAKVHRLTSAVIGNKPAVATRSSEKLTLRSRRKNTRFQFSCLVFQEYYPNSCAK